MSKQSVAKEDQNYRAKEIPKTCVNCKNLKQNFFHYDEKYNRVEGANPDTSKYARPTYSDNLRCGIGEFAVKKSAACDSFDKK